MSWRGRSLRSRIACNGQGDGTRRREQVAGRHSGGGHETRRRTAALGKGAETSCQPHRLPRESPSGIGARRKPRPASIFRASAVCMPMTTRVGRTRCTTTSGMGPGPTEDGVERCHSTVGQRGTDMCASRCKEARRGLFASWETKHFSPLTRYVLEYGGRRTCDAHDLKWGRSNAGRQARAIMAKKKRGAMVSDLPRRVAMDPTLPLWV